MKMSKKIASVACAALMASQMLAFNASAETMYGYNGMYFPTAAQAAAAAGGSGYTVVDSTQIAGDTVTRYYSSATGKFYISEANANTMGGGTVTAILVNLNEYNSKVTAAAPSNPYITGYYSSVTGKTYSTYAAALAASNNDSAKVSTIYAPGYNVTTGSSITGYYSSYTKSYYSTYAAALAASNGNAAYVSAVYGNGYYYGAVTGYYSSYTGKYYSTYAAAVAASKNDSSYVSPVYNNEYNPYYNTAVIYKYLYKGVYYPTLDAAVAAGGTVGVDIYYSAIGNGSDTKYYYYYNGTYYGSLQAAINAGGTAVGKDISYVPYNYYHNVYNYNGTIYTPSNSYVYKGFGDPYFAYRLFSSNTSSSSSSSSSKVTDGDGTPYIYGNKSKAGWDTIENIIKKASKGSSYVVDMNGGSEIDEDIMEALKGKNVNVTFVLDNGVKWTINGTKIKKADDVIIYTEYNIDYIPSSLVKKASKNAVAKAQVGISATFDKLGTKADVTVGFSSKRAGCTATVYRYDPATNSLKGVDKAKVQSNGKCTITVDQGGPYLFVLK